MFGTLGCVNITLFLHIREVHRFPFILLLVSSFVLLLLPEEKSDRRSSVGGDSLCPPLVSLRLLTSGVREMLPQRRPTDVLGRSQVSGQSIGCGVGKGPKGLITSLGEIKEVQILIEGLQRSGSHDFIGDTKRINNT